MDSLFLPVDIIGNRFLNADETTSRRKVELINGESYAVFLKFLSGQTVVSLEISSFSFVVRQNNNGEDVLVGGSLSAGTGQYAKQFVLNCQSPTLNLALSGNTRVDLVAQAVWSQSGGSVEVISPITARFTNSNTGQPFLGYLQSVNGVTGQAVITGQNGITVFKQGQNIFVSGDFVSESETGILATQAHLAATGTGLAGRLAATGSNLQNQISILSGNVNIRATSGALAATGAGLESKISTLSGYANATFYPKGNPSGFITGFSSGNYATTGALISATGVLQGQIDGVRTASGNLVTKAELAATGSNVQSQINSINAQSGNFVLKSVGSGYVTTGQSGQFATANNLSLTGAILGNQISAITGASGNFATANNLRATGSSLKTDINSLSGFANANYYGKANPSGFITGFNSGQFASTGQLNAASGSLQGQISTLNSQTGTFYPRSNPSGYLTGFNSGVFATVGNLTGLSGYLQNQITSITGASGSYATVGNLGATGSTLQSQINSLNGQTGGYYPRSTPSGFLGSGQTGVLASANSLSITGATLRAADAAISGNLNSTGSSLQTQINQLKAASGSFYPLTGNPSGFLTSGTVATQSQLSGLQSQVTVLSGKVVFTTGNQTIAGQKTFSTLTGIFVDRLASVNGTFTVNLASGKWTDQGGTGAIDVANRRLQDQYGLPSVDFSTRRLFNSAGSGGMNWEQQIIYSDSEIPVIDWGNGFLYQPTGGATVGWHSHNLIYDSQTTVDWAVGSLTSPANGIQTLNWQTQQLFDSAGAIVVNWEQRYLMNGGVIKVHWANGTLTNDTIETTLNWNNRVLSGDWATDTSPTTGQHIVNLNYLRTGSFPVANQAVRTTGNQLVSGEKTFFNRLAFRSGFNASGDVNIYSTGNVQALMSVGDTIFTLRSPVGAVSSVDVRNRNLADANGVNSVNWGNYSLISAGFTTVQWSGRQLSGQWTFENIAGSTSIGAASVSSVNLDWNTANYFYQPLSGTGLSVSFSNPREGQTINVVTRSTGNSRISWPTGVQGMPINWAGNVAFSGTSGSAATGKKDVFTFLRLGGEIFASYSANHFKI